MRMPEGLTGEHPRLACWESEEDSKQKITKQAKLWFPEAGVLCCLRCLLLRKCFGELPKPSVFVVWLIRVIRVIRGSTTKPTAGSESLLQLHVPEPASDGGNRLVVVTTEGCRSRYKRRIFIEHVLHPKRHCGVI